MFRLYSPQLTHNRLPALGVLPLQVPFLDKPQTTNNKPTNRKPQTIKIGINFLFCDQTIYYMDKLIDRPISQVKALRPVLKRNQTTILAGLFIAAVVVAAIVAYKRYHHEPKEVEEFADAV